MLIVWRKQAVIWTTRGGKFILSPTSFDVEARRGGRDDQRQRGHQPLA